MHGESDNCISPFDDAMFTNSSAASRATKVVKCHPSCLRSIDTHPETKYSIHVSKKTVSVNRHVAMNIDILKATV